MGKPSGRQTTPAHQPTVAEARAALTAVEQQITDIVTEQDRISASRAALARDPAAFQATYDAAQSISHEVERLNHVKRDAQREVIAAEEREAAAARERRRAHVLDLSNRRNQILADLDAALGTVLEASEQLAALDGEIASLGITCQTAQFIVPVAVKCSLRRFVHVDTLMDGLQASKFSTLLRDPTAPPAPQPVLPPVLPAFQSEPYPTEGWWSKHHAENEERAAEYERAQSAPQESWVGK